MSQRLMIGATCLLGKMPQCLLTGAEKPTDTIENEYHNVIRYGHYSRVATIKGQHLTKLT